MPALPTRSHPCASRLVGVIQNTAAVPTDRQPGDRVDLVVKIAKPTELAFEWPIERAPKPKAKPGKADKGKKRR